MNILITHAYSTHNKGDAALLGVLMHEAQREFPKANITILTMDQTNIGKEFEGVTMQPSFMAFANGHMDNKLGGLLYGLGMMVYTLLYAALKKLRIHIPLPRDWQKTVQLYEKTDLIIPVGGGYIRTNQKIGSIFGLLLLLHPLLFSRLLDKPTVIYPQSIGPFYRAAEKRLVAWTLKKAVNLVIIREDTSMALLKTLGVYHTVRSVDAGFLIGEGNAARPVKLPIPAGRLRIGVTARKWLDTAGQHSYETALAQTLDYLVEKHHAYIVFIPQVTAVAQGDDDRETSKAIFKKMKHQQDALVLMEHYSYGEIKTIYDQLDYILGTRFHSVIFSLVSYVPALAIEYEHKTSGIMHDLNLDEWVVKMEEVTPEVLTKKMDTLIRERSTYLNQLRNVLPGYIAKAHEAISLTGDAYQQHKKRGQRRVK